MTRSDTTRGDTTRGDTRNSPVFTFGLAPCLAGALALWGMCGAGAAQAATVTLTYGPEQRGADPCASTATAGAITGTMPNQCIYAISPDHVVLGDDGFFTSADIAADPGYRFDLLAADLFDIVTIERIDAAALSAYAALYAGLSVADQTGPVHGVYDWGAWPVPFLETWTGYTGAPDPESGLLVEGYRGGALVAEQLFQGGGDALGFGADFTGLDAVRFSAVNGAGLYGIGPTWVQSGTRYGYYYACEGGCVGAAYDNVIVDLYPVATVPLPAAFWGLGAGLMLLAGARARRRGA